MVGPEELDPRHEGAARLVVQRWRKRLDLVLGEGIDRWLQWLSAARDMALASLGALIAMTVTAAINGWLQRDFAREWVESFRVKGVDPLGENLFAAGGKPTRFVA